MPAWRIYYSDGSTFDDTQGDPEDAPGLGVLCIVMHDPECGRYVQSGDDFYWWENGRWDGGDLFGLWDYLVRPGMKVVKFGRSVERQAFRTILRRAVDDPDFPSKSAWRRGETKV